MKNYEILNMPLTQGMDRDTLVINNLEHQN